MAYCFKCGTELIPGAEFCYSCGTRVPEVVFQDQGQTAQSQHQNQRIREEKQENEHFSADAEQRSAEAETDVLKEVSVPQIIIDEMITVNQISRSDTIIIRDPKLAAPVRIRLRPDLKDGSLLRIKEARVRIYGGEAVIPVVVRLHVKNPLNEPEPAARPRYEQPSQVQNDSYLRSQRTDAVPPAGEHASMRTSSASPVTCRIAFQLDMPEEIGKFKLGGSEDDGHVDIYADRIVLFRINKLVTQGLGLAGHLIAGKGKELEQIDRADVIQVEKQLGKKGELMHYYLTLTGGRVLKLRLLGFDNAVAHQAMDRFLGV